MFVERYPFKWLVLHLLTLFLLLGCDSGTSTPGADNANLSDIQLSARELDQIFQASSLEYTAIVGYLAKSIQITASAESENATITINGVETDSGVASDSISLGAAAGTEITIDVTAADGSTAKSYTLTITREDLQLFIQQAYAKASNTGKEDFFGRSVALYGDTLAVGASDEDSNGTGVNSDSSMNNDAPDSGAVYVFTRNENIWSQQAYIKASNTGEGDEFGRNVALYGDTLAVGAFLEDSDGTGANSDNSMNNDALNSGAVYVFTRNENTWSQQAYIKASNTGGEDEFGYGLALYGDTLAVGAHEEDGNDSNIDSGAVYVFERSAGIWSQQAYIKASNTGEGDQFGESVTLYGDTLVVGASKEDSNGTGVNSDGLTNNDAPSSGAVYVFERSAGNWNQQAYIKASNTGESDQFGESVTLDGDTLAVGARYERSDGTGVNSDSLTNNDTLDSGAVYVFTRNENTWSQQAYIKASNTGGDDQFGRSVTLYGDTLAVGAGYESSNGTGVNSDSLTNNDAYYSGAVYVFTRNENTWSQQAFVKASNTGEGDLFGRSVALYGDTLAVGASKEGSNGTGVHSDSLANNDALDSGAVYVFR